MISCDPRDIVQQMSCLRCLNVAQADAVNLYLICQGTNQGFVGPSYPAGDILDTAGFAILGTDGQPIMFTSATP